MRIKSDKSTPLHLHLDLTEEMVADFVGVHDEASDISELFNELYIGSAGDNALGYQIATSVIDQVPAEQFPYAGMTREDWTELRECLGRYRNASTGDFQPTPAWVAKNADKAPATA